MIEKIYSRMSAINKWVTSILTAVACVLIVVWVCIVVVYCFGRFVGIYTWQFVEEFTGYFFLSTSAFGLAYAAVKGAHISVSIVVMHLPKRIRFILEGICLAVCVFWAVLITRAISIWFLRALSTGSMSWGGVPLWIPNLILTMGFASLALASLLGFFHWVMAAARPSQTLENKVNVEVGEL